MLGSIPSPHSGVVSLGPLHLHMYGLTLLVAILACIYLTGRRWTARGGDWDLVTRVAVWGVAFGVVGARAYHDVTSWSEVPSPKWQGVFEVWRGGLGIWGGILFGTLAGAAVLRRNGVRVAPFMDAAAPGLLLAQGIGRIGNWWNQELYGKPTSLPWGLRIDSAHQPADPRYFGFTTYQPTFLYELIWDVVGVGVLLWLDRRYKLRAPGLFALYVAWYCFGRFFEELLRIDPAHHVAGLRLNAWVSIVVFAGAVAFFLWNRRRSRLEEHPKRREPPKGPAMAIPRGRVR
ncbi:MAG TPA: prolipoprotein diacylglyceryl transferase [Gaiellaceae bacterium]|nr:prolipoprotein diacylglyceryl transferase [Gaiellaceae bacterium]